LTVDTPQTIDQVTHAWSGAASERRGTAFSSKKLGQWLMASDIAVAILAGGASAHDLLSYIGHTELLSMYFVAIAGGTAILVLVFKMMGLYDFSHVSQTTPPLRRLILATAISMFALTAISFGLRLDFMDFPYARTWLGVWFSLTGVGIIVARVAVRTAIVSMSRSGRLRRNVAIIGGGQQAARIYEALAGQSEPWNHVVGVFDDRAERRNPDAMPHPRSGSIRNLIECVRMNMVDDIVVALPWSANSRLIELVTLLDDLPVDIHLGSDLAYFAFPSSNVGSLSGVAVLDVVQNPLTGWRAILKSIEDKVVSSVALVVLSPLLLAVAMAVRFTSPGPILFRQSRYGFNNQIFHVLKFRSMYHNRPPETGTPQATKNDPRITPVGRFIRRTSLDELPQLFNVLEGTMSLVGPRPHAVDHNELYGGVIESYFARHRMKPGITGWAQVNGLRGETDTPEKMQARVKFDLEYIAKWSLWLDLKIILKTAMIVLFQKSAY
jgi:Undecaprenyl-phosphate glucose phosphotransferase